MLYRPYLSIPLLTYTKFPRRSDSGLMTNVSNAPRFSGSFGFDVALVTHISSRLQKRGSLSDSEER